jgi:hypothetical protein
MTNTIDRLEFTLRDLSQRLANPRKQIEDWRLRMDDYSFWIAKKSGFDGGKVDW